jgi:hypothetical protein
VQAATLFSLAPLTPVLIAHAPPTIAAAVTPMTTFRVRLIVRFRRLLRYMTAPLRRLRSSNDNYGAVKIEGSGAPP